MAKKSSTIGCQITDRDVELLIAIDRHPMTTGQLFQLSQTFAQPFSDDRLLRRRLAILRAVGLLQNWPLATVSNGGLPHYWKLTREGYKTLYGQDVALPKRRYFEQVSTGHHHHTRCQGEFLTHLFATAVKNGVAVHQFARENSVRIECAAGLVYPDCAFQLIRDGRRYNFCVEIDNGTERVRSTQDTESIQRKLVTYEAHQRQFEARDPRRYVVLLITTRSELRIGHMLEVATDVMGDSKRTVFLGCGLDAFKQSDPFRDDVLRDHLSQSRPLIRPLKSAAKSQFDRRDDSIALR